MTRTARCNCGQLKAFVEGDPARVSVCHCLNCKLRTGSAFSYNATFREDQIRTEGETRTYQRQTDSGNTNTYWFCGTCGSTVYYRVGIRPGMVSIPAGCFADPAFPAPSVELFPERASDWCELQIG